VNATRTIETVGFWRVDEQTASGQTIGSRRGFRDTRPAESRAAALATPELTPAGPREASQHTLNFAKFTLSDVFY
jgi:hypothetical protein